MARGREDEGGEGGERARRDFEATVLVSFYFSYCFYTTFRFAFIVGGLAKTVRFEGDGELFDGNASSKRFSSPSLLSFSSFSVRSFYSFLLLLPKEQG